MFEALYEDYQKPIERYLVKWVRNKEDAREICQDTFEYFWQFLTKETVVQSAAKYKGDLYTTAKYRAIGHLRRQNKTIVYLSQSESEANSWFDELRTEGREDIIEDLICTQDDLLQLPQKQREYLVEYALGHKQKEIAEEKGISKSTVSEYIRLGRTNLRNRKSFVVTVDLKHAEASFVSCYQAGLSVSSVTVDLKRVEVPYPQEIGRLLSIGSMGWKKLMLHARLFVIARYKNREVVVDADVLDAELIRLYTQRHEGTKL
jgi:RNA polymerase sigma factor (sigma-70 family)